MLMLMLKVFSLVRKKFYAYERRGCRLVCRTAYPDAAKVFARSVIFQTYIDFPTYVILH